MCVYHNILVVLGDGQCWKPSLLLLMMMNDERKDVVGSCLQNASHVSVDSRKLFLSPLEIRFHFFVVIGRYDDLTVMSRQFVASGQIQRKQIVFVVSIAPPCL